MKKKTIELYKIDELPVEARVKTIEKHSDINVDYDWWDFIYQDAERIGLKISQFDVYNRKIDADFILEPEQVAKNIMNEYANSAPLHTAAKSFLDTNDVYELEDFEHEVKRQYLKDLREQYEHSTSNEAVIETLKANEYYFDLEGEIHTPDYIPTLRERLAKIFRTIRQRLSWLDLFMALPAMTAIIRAFLTA
jgi:hypothetical protein